MGIWHYLCLFGCRLVVDFAGILYHEIYIISGLQYGRTAQDIIFNWPAGP